jgi:uridine kinase
VCRAKPGTVWIGVDGKAGTGKTTLANQMQAAIGHDAVVISIDCFARPDISGWERERFSRQVVAPLLAGRTARYQRWDWVSGVPGEWVEVPPGVPVIVEGVSCTDVRVPVPWDLTVWMEAPREVRLKRALERDGPHLLDRWLTDWMPSEDAYEREQSPKDRVDLVVSAYDQEGRGSDEQSAGCR